MFRINAFRYLHFQLGWRELVLFHQTFQDCSHIQAPDTDSGSIYRDRNGGISFFVPLMKMEAQGFPDVAVQFLNQVILFQYGYELAGGDESGCRMVPSDKGFGADYLAGGNVIFRLEIKLEIMVFQGGFKVG